MPSAIVFLRPLGLRLDTIRIDRLKLFLDFVGGGAWPFLVGGVICLVNSVNERDADLLNSTAQRLTSEAVDVVGHSCPRLSAVDL